MKYITNIRHKKTISAEDFLMRINLYATWIHLLNAMIQTIIGQWNRFVNKGKELSGIWRLQSDVNKLTKTFKSAQVYLEKYSERLDNLDLAEWKNVKDQLAVHDKEQEQINKAIVIFGLYYLTCYGNTDNQDKLIEFMNSLKSGEIDNSATDVFALNYLYTLNID